MIKTWLKWCGDKHQQLFDWATDINIPTWKTVLRTLVFYTVDTLIWFVLLMGLIFAVACIAAKFVKDEPILEE